MLSFNQILEKYRKLSTSERNKGERFERLMQGFLLTDPLYANKFKNVWLWSEFPSKGDLGSIDSGIDLVALTHEGDYWAVQCKFYDERTYIDKGSVDSFLSTSSRSFLDQDNKTIHFSERLWISTSEKWSSNAEEVLKNQSIPFNRIGRKNLEESIIDWEKLEQGIHGVSALKPKYELKEHQKTALNNANDYFQTHNRGKMIMACGTGKTFTSLKIAENETNGNGLILFLVPSIALMGQTLREWTNHAQKTIQPICICSDPKVSGKRNKDEDNDLTGVIDIPLPASTNVNAILKQFDKYKHDNKEGLKVVFSTYQSIQVIAEAQKELAQIYPEFAEFDLIICDEAHRTTGVTLVNEDESTFVKVHKNDFLKAKKRLYMTATPRLFSDNSKSQAAKTEAILCSMDDEEIYGEEFYRIGFGEAVEKGLLTDYKVLVLTLNENDVPRGIQRALAKDNGVIEMDDISKLIGCVNALSKKVLGDEGILKISDPAPMRRAVAFCSNIAVSNKISNIFIQTADEYKSSLPEDKASEMVSIHSRHIDGSMNAPARDELLSWLKDDINEGDCRVLTNVRCLSEGVDVPSLDAVLFLSPRNSQVDVVQSVGRVMRKAEGKNCGYVIIPIFVSAHENATDVLDKGDKFKVVWSVLNALRAHDDRFNALINKIDLNNSKPKQILVGTTLTAFDSDGNPYEKNEDGTSKKIENQLQMDFPDLQKTIFAKLVEKCGDRYYWETWAKQVAVIYEELYQYLNELIQNNPKEKAVFNEFLQSMRKNINPSITEDEALTMLGQHLISEPIFKALFSHFKFLDKNPVSIYINTILHQLDRTKIDEFIKPLQKFYESIQLKVGKIDNAKGRREVTVKLYDSFFKIAFPKTTEKLGIVYTPDVVVDFMIHSVNDVLKKEFNRTLSDENVNILEPFVGVGTFITHIIESDLIKKEDLKRKFEHEIKANEIVLLAYYIASVNIEDAFYDQMADENYVPFSGIALTDTFQITEKVNQDLFSANLNENHAKIENLRNFPINIIIGNPPYSVGQKSANDNAQNQSYPILEGRIASTYAKLTDANNKNSLYDSYIKAFRWSTDRLDDKGGILGYVSNGTWLDGNAADGFRKTLEKEFTSIYVFNLRGNQRTSGELSRKEGGKIFGSGSRTPISITILVKNPSKQNEKAKIYYCDIGDYLSREDKFQILKSKKSILNLDLVDLIPNEQGDWITKRNEGFESFIQIGDKENRDNLCTYFVSIYSRGIGTSRDAWVYQFSKEKLQIQIQNTINYFNIERIKSETNDDYVIIPDVEKGVWTSDWKKLLLKKNELLESKSSYIHGIYRPFFKQNLYCEKNLIYEYSLVVSKHFPTPNHKNLVICISGLGGSKENTTLITNLIPDLNILDSGTQCFPLHYYEEAKTQKTSLFDGAEEKEYIKRDGITDFILKEAQNKYGNAVNKEDIFYYVYGFLHCPAYREKYKNDLKKMLPRLPLVENVMDFWAFSKAGRKLADLHINYETVPAYPDVVIKGIPPLEKGGLGGDFFKVTKMKFPHKLQTDTIIFNSKITIENIPAKAYDYEVNGKSAIEWIMDKYAIETHKDSQITNDPNDWCEETNNPRYIFDLLLSIINVSVQTVDIVEGLPVVEFE